MKKEVNLYFVDIIKKINELSLLYSLPKAIETDISEYLKGYNEYELCELGFRFLLASEPFFYYDAWVDKLNEEIDRVKKEHNIIFDIRMFCFIDLKTNAIVKRLNRDYYMNILKEKADSHFERKHYETSYNIYKEINYLYESDEISRKIKKCYKLMNKHH